jgi:hypothetical protein
MTEEEIAAAQAAMLANAAPAPAASASEPGTDTENSNAKTKEGIARAMKELEDEENQKSANFGNKLTEAGALAGAAAQYKGGVGLGRTLKPGAGVFSSPDGAPTADVGAPPPTDTTSPLDATVQKLHEQQMQREEAVNAKLREMTGDPTASTKTMTHAQIERALSGGPGPDLGISGWQREDTKNTRSKTRAKVDDFFENLQKQHGLDPNKPYYEAGEMVTLPSGLQVPAAEARRMADDRAREASNLLRQHENDTEAHNATIDALNQAKQTNAQTATAAQQQTAAANAIAQNRRNKIMGIAKGTGRMALGALGGAEAAKQGLNMYEQHRQGVEPDWTQMLSTAGGLTSALAKSPIVGAAGQVAQIPYMYYHGNDIARGMTMGDVVPSTAAMGMSQDELESPLNQFQKNVPPSPQAPSISDLLAEFRRRYTPAAKRTN